MPNISIKMSNLPLIFDKAYVTMNLYNNVAMGRSYYEKVNRCFGWCR